MVRSFLGKEKASNKKTKTIITVIKRRRAPLFHLYLKAKRGANCTRKTTRLSRMILQGTFLGLTKTKNFRCLLVSAAEASERQSGGEGEGGGGGDVLFCAHIYVSPYGQ